MTMKKFVAVVTTCMCMLSGFAFAFTVAPDTSAGIIVPNEGGDRI